MKNFVYSAFLIALLVLSACSSNIMPKHDSPKFLAVVDSICIKYATEKGYDAHSVIKGMHDYINYFASNETPIFKDLPMKLTGITTANTLDGKKLVSLRFTYDFEEPTENGKRVYTLNVMVENEYEADDALQVTEGESYIIIPNGGLVYYDGMLDIVGIKESQNGKIIDGRSFGSVKLKGASFVKAN